MRTFLLIMFCGIVGGLVVSHISSITPFGMVLISLVILWGASKALDLIERSYNEIKNEKKE